MTEASIPTLAGTAKLRALTLSALGVVYGDIGTSPLYTLRECFDPGGQRFGLTPDNILGVLSLIFWALVIVVTVKYVIFVMRADNQGEGGILALIALALRGMRPAATDGPWRSWRSASSVRRCSTATASSRRPSRCSARSRA